MFCPYCANEKSAVIGTLEKSKTVERFRHCVKCGFIWLSVEFIKFSDEAKRYAKGSL